jgi:hypothetical protein
MDVVLALLGYKLGWRKIQILCFLLFLAGAILLALPFTNGLTQTGWRTLFGNLSTILLQLSAGVSGIAFIPYFRRRSALYAAAFASPIGNVPWVVNQPMPDTTPITSPIIIRRRIRWPAALAWHALFYAAVMTLFVGG